MTGSADIACGHFDAESGSWSEHKSVETVHGTIEDLCEATVLELLRFAREEIQDRIGVSSKLQIASTATVAQIARAGRKRGPKTGYETAERVAAVVKRVCPNGVARARLDDICECLDDEKIPYPKTWTTRGHRTWYDAFAERPDLVAKAIKHHLKRKKEHESRTFS